MEIPDDIFKLPMAQMAGLKTANDNLNAILNVLASNYWIGETILPSFENVNKVTNRDFYVWQLKALDKLESAVNTVITIFNDKKLATAPDYIRLNLIRLDKPDALALDAVYLKK